VSTEQAKRRRVVVVEYDITGLTPEQVDELLLRALIGDQGASFRVEDAP
jgi:hypothetical protein